MRSDIPSFHNKRTCTAKVINSSMMTSYISCSHSTSLPFPLSPSSSSPLSLPLSVSLFLSLCCLLSLHPPAPGRCYIRTGRETPPSSSGWWRETPLTAPSLRDWGSTSCTTSRSWPSRASGMGCPAPRPSWRGLWMMVGLHSGPVSRDLV